MKEESIWNPFIIRGDTVVDSIATHYGVSKSEILNPDDDNLASRVAIAEAKVITETKKFLEGEGIVIADFTGSKKSAARSQTVILVKNIPFSTTESEIMHLFQKFGSLVRVVLPPSRGLAVVEFSEVTEAKSAFKNLAYSRFHNVPLYLEWAPLVILKKGHSAKENPTDVGKTEQAKQLLDNFLDTPRETLYVKNLNFTTTAEQIREHFESQVPVKSVTISKKRVGTQLVSSGFGFIEFFDKDAALDALKRFQRTTIDGFRIELNFARPAESGVKHKRKREALGEATSKLLVKNVAFEATKKDLRALFSNFAEVKSVRLPQNMQGRNRGFAFVEFVSKQEARNALDKLQDTHLYGRHLVLAFAKTVDSEAPPAKRMRKDF
eukprot:TRINITY_DN10962_c0_g2_i1.p1 TRINITY_DN10962_c0_g2~~TRINITY_DN10962_c0_g2_i1.p1  ORF type:complete len:380 (+),score=68.17 TRINITY_DN10962_c0_g2_i1:756-1895(+)